MSKGLEAFKELLCCPIEIAFVKKNGKLDGTMGRIQLRNSIEYNEQLLTIEKELKALEIIKCKNVNIRYLQECTFKHYNGLVEYEEELTQEEYELLKKELL